MDLGWDELASWSSEEEEALEEGEAEGDREHDLEGEVGRGWVGAHGGEGVP